MTNTRIEAWITGIGIASSLGEGLDEHWDALQAGRINADTTTFAPYIVHPMAALAFDKQIPKKEQRQMEAWQRIGTYAAGLALDSAGIKGNSEVLGRTDMIVAAGGGERDLAVDSAILNEKVRGNAPPHFLNERLMSDLRPTLFLAQLSNLLAGNISIVHGVTGSSRTFMGEESAGVDAIRISLARILSGQSDIALVGAAHNGERKDLLMLYEFGGYNLKDTFKPVMARDGDGGFALGSGGVFLVIESRKHAEARGARPFAKLSGVAADRAHRSDDGQLEGTLQKLWDQLGITDPNAAVITGATGAKQPTHAEQSFLSGKPDVAVRSTGSRFGHIVEAQFPLGVALAALSLSKGAMFSPLKDDPAEIESAKSASQIVVIGTGHWRGEGMALVEPVN